PMGTSLPKPHLTVGAIGHHDHGMTTLVAAVVARQACKNRLDRFKSYKEIARGGTERDELKTITHAPTHGDYETARRHYAHIDCPGHMDRAKANIRALNKMDGPIVGVAADAGAMPQTREHLLLARQSNVSHLVVFLSKVDAVDDPQLIDLVELDLRETLSKYGFP